MVESSSRRWRWILAWLGWLHALALLAPLIATDRPLFLIGSDATRGRAALESLSGLVGLGDAEGMQASLTILAQESADPAPIERAQQLAGAERIAAVQALVQSASAWRPRERWCSPAFESLDAWTRASLLLVPWCLLLPWICSAQRRRAQRLAWAGSLLVGSLCWLPASPAAPAGEFKQALADGQAQARLVWFAPIPYSPLELKPAEAWRTPGYRAIEEPSSLGELQAQAAPVRVLPGEAPESSWRRHWLGTDALGRDFAARLLHGARVSLLVGLLAALLASAVGALAGAAAGLWGGWVDALCSACVEVLACIPGLLVVLLVMSFARVGSTGSMVWLVAVLVLFGWATPARMVRAQALRVRELDYVLAAQGLGCSRLQILLRHVLPNSIDSALVGVGFLAGSAMLLESTVSFLGVGIAEPVPSLGALVASAVGRGWSIVCTGAVLALVLLPWHALTDLLRARLESGREGA
jgi:peptide/nickel transport system permease protein